MASDGQLASAPATVTITVTLPNAVNGGGASSGSNGASGPANSSSGAGSDGGSTLPQAVDTSLASGAPPGFATYTEDSAGGREAHRDAHGDASAAGEASALPERSLQVQQRASEGASSDYDLDSAAGSVIDVHRGYDQLRDEEELLIELHRLGDTDWLLHNGEDQTKETHGRGAFTFVAPAKWTVISTGIVLWAVRVGQVVATLASSASAFMPFDPLTVIQQAHLNGSKDDDSEANSITEQMFDNQQKK
jgi:hypothetical protein